MVQLPVIFLMAMAEPRENIPNLALSLGIPDYANFANVALSKGSHVVKFCSNEKGQYTTRVGMGKNEYLSAII